MEYSVSAQPGEIIFAAEGIEAILQNVRTIVTTVKGTVPLDRGFGVDYIDLDTPIPIAQAQLTAKILDAIEQYEPRVEVVSVQYNNEGSDGRLMPIVKIRIREGVTV
ncbi:GPW/gp25 family protein [Paenibacillus cisolokensis]|uniref:GPW/gp25 family protein n=1 Tax=Paenibacillus cisolokensis TaxID=1658519 RepID=UPI003D2DF848